MRDYRTTNTALKTDAQKLIDADPNSVEVLIFRAVNADVETLTDTADVVGSIENRERNITWEDPVISKMLFCDFADLEFLKGYMSGGESALEMISPEQQIRVLLMDETVPEQSVIQWEEAADGADKVRELRFFVTGIEVVGQAPGAVVKYVLSPFGDSEPGE